jgi:putative ABC transport system ATP-binding protein
MSGRLTAGVVAVRGITKTYRRGPEAVHALRGVDLELVAGELVALVGPSGSGKTTLLNVLAGWEQPEDGEVVWDGVAHPALPTEARVWGRVAIVPQTLGLLDELTIAENVRLPVRFGAATADDAATHADGLVTRLGLDEVADRLPGEVSLGERQRAAVARALCAAPDLLLADEPTAHQDAAWAGHLLEVVRDACAAGTSCLVATHNPELLAAVDRVVRLHDGQFTA